LHCTFGKVDPKILDCIINKCGGNPLLCFTFFIVLLQDGWIEVMDTENTKIGKVLIKEKFEKALHLGDFTEIPVPRISMKLNCAFLDKVVSNVTKAAMARK
jgi:hypothetical protein